MVAVVGGGVSAVRGCGGVSASAAASNPVCSARPLLVRY